MSESNAVQVPVEPPVNSLVQSLDFSLDMDRIQVEVDKRLKKLAKTVKMPGFRPGKVPMKMIVQSYGPEVHSEVLNDELVKSFYDEAEKQSIRIAGGLKIAPANKNNLTSSADASTDVALGMHFTATFEVFPTIQFGDFSAIEVERVVATVDDAALNKTLDMLRKQKASFAEVARAAENGDQVECDFVGRIDGEEFAGGKAEGFKFILGQGQMLPEFEAAALGLSAGQSKTFPLNFPADYHGKEVAGKTAEFEITIQKVLAQQLPELDEAFAKAMGVPDGSIETFIKDVRENLEREVATRCKARTKDNVMNALLKVAEFDLPKSLVQDEITELAKNARENLKQRGLKDVENIKLPEDLFEAQAQKRVRLGLLVGDLVKTNQLKPKPEQIREHIEQVAKNYENPVEVMQWYFSDRARLADVETFVVEDNVVVYALTQFKVTDKTMSFDELMGSQA